MELRTYKELWNFVENLYNIKSLASLRNKVFVNSENQIHVFRSTPCEVPIIYGHGTNNEHQIELRVPGKLTFKHRATGKLTDDIQRYDIRIRLKNKELDDFVVPKHTEIVEELYYKIANSTDSNRSYSMVATILQNIYFDYYPLKRVQVSQASLYNLQYTGFSIPELITFIKWCTLQEDINFNPNNTHGKDDWGKDLLFARYFEAIYAGYLQDKVKLAEILKRTDNHGQDKPKLWDREIYQGTLATRFPLMDITK